MNSTEINVGQERTLRQFPIVSVAQVAAQSENTDDFFLSNKNNNGLPGRVGASCKRGWMVR